MLWHSVTHLAAISGNTKVLQTLLEEGADKDLVNRWGLSPLHVAIATGNSLSVDVLTRAGAGLVVGDPATAMCLAASQEDVHQVKCLCVRVGAHHCPACPCTSHA